MRRRARVWPLPVAVATLLFAGGAAAVIAEGGGSSGGKRAGLEVVNAPHRNRGKGHHGETIPPGIQLHGGRRVHVRLRPPAAGGLLFDVDTGHVLWSHDPLVVRPIASLTKIMTALLVVEHTNNQAQAKIGPDALHYTGSEVGVLPLGKDVSVNSLMYGLLLPSGNDAAVALADRIAGSDQNFAKMMNRRAHQLDLRCTHFVSSYGLQDGNRSCPVDVAALSRIVMARPRVAKIVATWHARLPFPIKGGWLDLYSHNPLMRLRYPGTIGLKTGFTNPAGKCFVGIARRGSHTLGAVLLNSMDIGGQARQLLDAGFQAEPG